MNENTGSESESSENIDQQNLVPQSSIKEEVTESNCRFQPGQPLKFVRVRFPGHARSYPFLIGQRKLVYGQKVMAMSDRGMAVGYVNSFTYELPFDKSMLPLKSINKIASEEDVASEQEIYHRQKSTETLCQRLIDKHNLDMNLTHVEFTQFGKKVVFYFVAPARVDFRGLVKDLVGELKLRIELRQISVRDRSASMGALGPCGRELCCSSFLSRYGNVSIKMAKNQNLTLNYSKLNGVCGQLKCCLQYEDEVYLQKRKALPPEGSFIETTNGDKGKIFRLHILSEQFDVLTERGKIKRYTQSYFKRKLKRTDVNMPDRFENISDETNTVLGLNDVEAQRSRQFENDMNKLKVKAGKYASEVFEELTGVSQEEQQVTPQQKEAEKEKELLKVEREAYQKQAKSTQDRKPVSTPRPTEKAHSESSDDQKSEQDRAAKPRQDRGDRRPKGKRPPRKGGQNKRRGPRPDQKANPKDSNKS
ncbi:MAG: hypothetical protein KC478_15490 [Bacteriovoracaceae bacterium]|nr:hypothetical protein [Bacteriovoracaceae bacterium]